MSYFRSGNFKFAGYIINLLSKAGGYGFNNLHEIALTKGKQDDLGQLKRVSVLKNSFGAKMTPLHAACINPNPEILRQFMEASGRESTIQDDKQKRPVSQPLKYFSFILNSFQIHYAAVCENDKNLNYLISLGVDTREKDFKKNSPLILACKFGRLCNVKVLIPVSNVDQKNKRANAAVHKVIL